MFLFTAASFFILGLATLWAMRVIYGGTRWAANRLLALSLSIIGWVFVLLGVAALVTPLGMLFVLVVFGMVVARYRLSERRALLWMLSLAAEKELPLSSTVRAFAARRSDEMARRALALADFLDAGMPLPQALGASGNPLPPDTEVLVRLSSHPSTMAAALRESGEFGDELEQAWTPIFGQLVYLLVVALFAMAIFTFIMVRIIPTYREIFADFGAEIPWATRLAIDLSDWFAAYSFLLVPLLLYVVGALLVGGYFYARGRIWMPPPFHWLCPRSDKPTMLRGLAVCIEQKLPISEAFRSLGRNYPIRRTQLRLAECAGATSVGADWCEVMQREKLITPEEAAVLRASVAAGGLGWALRELAEVATRSMIYRAATTLNITLTAGVLLLALPIALLVLACFIPLVNIILEAAHASV